MPGFQGPTMTADQEVGKEPLTRFQVLTRQLNLLVEKITLADVDIRVMERSDPALQVGREAAAHNPDGTPMSYKAVTAKDMLEKRRKDKAGYEIRHAAVMALLEMEAHGNG